MKIKLEYKRLASGFHYVRATEFHHLFAQWPVGEECKPEHVSQNHALDANEVLHFAYLANRARSGNGEGQS